MRRLFLLVVMGLVAGCSHEQRYVAMPGYAYKTDPTCERTAAKGAFDARCDCPKAGYGTTRPKPNACNL